MNEENAQVIDLGTRIGGRVVLRKIQAPQSQEEAEAVRTLMERLQTAAAADRHEVLWPTHVFLKGGEIVGYGSLGAMPVLNFWADSQKLGPAESVRMLEQGEAVASQAGLRTAVTLCAEDSPFRPQMERLGWRKVGVTELWMKSPVRNGVVEWWSDEKG